MDWNFIDMLPYLLMVLVGCYLIGSVNTAIIIGKLHSSIDIREHGSGNAGMTNTLRVMGKRAGIFVLIGDVLKAIIALLAVAWFVIPTLALEGEAAARFLYIGGTGVILGHNFPVYFKFKGGKGVLVSLVCIFFASPWIGLFALLTGVIIIAVTRYVSLGSILGAAVTVPAAAFVNTGDTLMMTYFMLITLLCVKMHQANIVRLMKKEESKLKFK